MTYLAFTGLTERQQLALAMEESKKAAAALQAKDRQASRQMDSEVSLCAYCCMVTSHFEGQLYADFHSISKLYEDLSLDVDAPVLTLLFIQDEYSDRQEGASESEQDSVSEDESAVKPHRRAIKSAQPARSLTSQHSDVASQLGQHDHKLCECLYF